MEAPGSERMRLVFIQIVQYWMQSWSGRPVSHVLPELSMTRSWSVAAPALQDSISQEKGKYPRNVLTKYSLKVPWIFGDYSEIFSYQETQKAAEFDGLYSAMEDWNAYSLQLCDHSFPAERSSSIFLYPRDQPLDSLHSELFVCDFATHKMEDPFVTPSYLTVEMPRNPQIGGGGGGWGCRKGLSQEKSVFFTAPWACSKEVVVIAFSGLPSPHPSPIRNQEEGVLAKGVFTEIRRFYDTVVGVLHVLQYGTPCAH